jgi:hypothetical protein
MLNWGLPATHGSEFIAPQFLVCCAGSDQCLNSTGDRRNRTNAYKMPISPPSPGSTFVAIRTIGVTTTGWSGLDASIMFQQDSGDGASAFAHDPQGSFHEQTIFWAPEALPTVVPIGRSASSSDVDGVGRSRVDLTAGDLLRAPDGWHAVLRIRGAEHRLWLTEPPTMTMSYTAVLALDSDFEVRPMLPVGCGGPSMGVRPVRHFTNSLLDAVAKRTVDPAATDNCVSDKFKRGRRRLQPAGVFACVFDPSLALGDADDEGMSFRSRSPSTSCDVIAAGVRESRRASAQARFARDGWSGCASRAFFRHAWGRAPCSPTDNAAARLRQEVGAAISRTRSALVQPQGEWRGRRRSSPQGPLTAVGDCGSRYLSPSSKAIIGRTLH